MFFFQNGSSEHFVGTEEEHYVLLGEIKNIPKAGPKANYIAYQHTAPIGCIMTATTRPATLYRIVSCGSSDNGCAGESDKADLRLAFLGCEVLPPYGPYEHTAELFADLIASAWSTALSLSSNSQPLPQPQEQSPQNQRTLVLEVYGVSGNHTKLPSEEDLATRFDGVVLPGSFSSAYETTTPWIRALGDWIQSTLVAKEIPTLGVCFGHQLYAHSFHGAGLPTPAPTPMSIGSSVGGTAAKCPAGPQAGRKTTTLTPSGRAFLDLARQRKTTPFDKDGQDENKNQNKNSIIAGCCGSLDLFYTHGDMVESLPPRGVSLGGNLKVPIQASLYFSSPLHAANAKAMLRNFANNRSFGFEGDNQHDAHDNSYSDDPKVIAVTFQAHPEFAGLGGGETTKGEETLRKTMLLMRDNGDLSEKDYQDANHDVDAAYKRVNEQSLDAIVAAGRLLGWFG
jgi:GMP synthase-like glutamine amidotransferase